MGTPPENIDSTTTTVTAAEETTGRGRQDITSQQLLIVAGVALVIVLALVYFFFLRGGGEEEVPPPPTAEGVPAPEETTGTEEPEDEDADEDDEGDVETFEVFAPRDPFDPLITEGGAAAGDGDAAGGDVGDGVDPGDGPDAAPPSTDDGDRIGDHRVKVIDVYVQGGNDRAQIQVDGTVYTVDEGEQFADNFELVSASGRCATILFGDDEFTLCEGEEILK